ncbi:MAG TPA: DUF502 domain-containing protein [Phycisphaerae bacterium]|nr:DUF502 domain-containing protein [Phycisphaerae bacterium]
MDLVPDQPGSGSNQSAEASRPRRLWPAVRALLRTRLVAGLLTVIPIWVTWVVVKFVFDTMKAATEPLAQKAADAIIKANKDLVPQKVQDYVDWMVPLLAVLLTLFMLYMLGLLAASVFGRRMILLIERVFGRLPLVKTIYNATKKIVLTFGGGQPLGFQRVVLVEFPRPGMKCVAFLTAVMRDMDTGRDMATVFIATTPNPTTGYMQILPLDEVSETNWSVEDTVKMVMSGGILSPAEVPFDKIHPVRVDDLPIRGGKPSSHSPADAGTI